jgi:hypothetical protein
MFEKFKQLLFEVDTLINNSKQSEQNMSKNQLLSNIESDIESSNGRNKSKKSFDTQIDATQRLMLVDDIAKKSYESE